MTWKCYKPGGRVKMWPCGVKRLLRGVVVLAQVTEEDVSELLMPELLDGFGTLVVGEVTMTFADAVLELFWIWAIAKHLKVVVGLDDHCVCPRGKAKSLTCHAADVGHYHKLIVVKHDSITHSLGSIVRDNEISDFNAVRDNLCP